MKGKQQSDRLSKQQKEADGVIGIFDEEAQKHDRKVTANSITIFQSFRKKFPQLSFRY